MQIDASAAMRIDDFYLLVDVMRWGKSPHKTFKGKVPYRRTDPVIRSRIHVNAYDSHSRVSSDIMFSLCLFYKLPEWRTDQKMTVAATLYSKCHQNSSDIVTTSCQNFGRIPSYHMSISTQWDHNMQRYRDAVFSRQRPRMTFDATRRRRSDSAKLRACSSMASHKNAAGTTPLRAQNAR